MGHLHPEFDAIMDEIQAGLKYAFQTENSLTLAVDGSGHAAMEAAIAETILSRCITQSTMYVKNSCIMVCMTPLHGLPFFVLHPSLFKMFLIRKLF